MVRSTWFSAHAAPTKSGHVRLERVWVVDAPGNAVEEEEPSGEDVVQLVQGAEVQVGWDSAAAIVDV